MALFGHQANSLTHRGIAALLRRDDGGGIDVNTPSVNTQNPLAQGMIQRYAGLPVEKLQELATQLGGTPQGQVVESILRQKRFDPNESGNQDQQASTPGYAGGGAMGIPMGEASPWWERSEARQAGATYLNGSTLGRADSIRTQAPSGAYVLPADFVSGIGDGNSTAGARIVQHAISTGPFGTPLPAQVGGRGLVRAPAPRMQMEAKGGTVQPQPSGAPVDVMLSHGEVVLSPQTVLRIGRGNMKRGHAILDAWVLMERKKHIAKLKSLPPPVKSK